MSGVSLDTNILISLWRAEATAPAVVEALREYAARWRLVLSGPAYAELCGFYIGIEAQLGVLDIQIMPDMPLSAWQRAGQAHATYTARRRRSGGGLPRQMLTDYLIGAHASVHSLSLFTLNPDDYTDFPEVPILTP